MSKLVKIYDGMTFDMSTGEVLSHGDVTYHAEEDVAQCGGGGPSTQTTTSGFAQEYKPQIAGMMADAKGMYDSGQLGQVAGFSQAGLDAQAAGLAAADRQTGLEKGLYDVSQTTGLDATNNQTALEQNMFNVAQQPLDTSGMRARAMQEAQGSLNTSTNMAGQRGGLGGSRQSLNQAGITQGLAAQFAGIDQQAQQQQMSNMNTAMGAQGTGARQQMSNMNAALGVQGQGAQTMGMIGQAQQQQAQRLADAPYTALAQQIGLFSGIAPKEQTTNKTGGK